MENNFPKYQVSKMIGEYQIVFRTDDEAEFKTFVASIDSYKIGASLPTPTKSQPAPATSYGFKKQEAGEVCNKCGTAKIVLNPRTGKTFCESKCWLNGAKTY